MPRPRVKHPSSPPVVQPSTGPRTPRAPAGTRRQRPDSQRSGQVESLLALLDAAYDHHSWHGPNLRGSLRGLQLDEASWRPAPGRHNIWELLVHAAYWKYVALRRLTGAGKGAFVYKGSNWFTRPEPTASWKADMAALDAAHRALREAVVALTPAQLAERPAGSQVTTFALLSGVAAHDVYHAGQIQLLKRLFRDRTGRR